MILQASNSPSPLLSTGSVPCTSFSFADVSISSSVFYGFFLVLITAFDPFPVHTASMCSLTVIMYVPHPQIGIKTIAQTTGKDGYLPKPLASAKVLSDLECLIAKHVFPPTLIRYGHLDHRLRG